MKPQKFMVKQLQALCLLKLLISKMTPCIVSLEGRKHRAIVWWKAEEQRGWGKRANILLPSSSTLAFFYF